MPGPDKHPPLPASCPTGAFYGDPPTRRNQPTRGRLLSANEAATKKAILDTALAYAKARLPLAAENLLHWLGGTGTTKVLAADLFKKVESEVPTFLHEKARNAFEKGITERLKNPNHPQGTLRPATLTPGLKGPVRFVQHVDGVQPSIFSDASRNYQGALGGFNIHSVLWAQATFIGHKGGIIGIGGDDVFEIEILKWCVQIYDVYDWNNTSNVPLIAPFTITNAELKVLLTKVKLPIDGVRIQTLGFNTNAVFIADRLLSELEVSGVGRAYLIRSEAFEAPATARGKFTVKL